MTKTIKATAPFAGVERTSQGRGLQEVHLLRIDGGVKTVRYRAGFSAGPIGACGEDFVRQEHFHNVSSLAALYEPQDPAGNEAAYGPARGITAEADAT